jgi:hypothetical protein
VVKPSLKADLMRQSVLFVVLSICGAPFNTFVLFLPSSWTTHSIALAVKGKPFLAQAKDDPVSVKTLIAPHPASSIEMDTYMERYLEEGDWVVSLRPPSLTRASVRRCRVVSRIHHVIRSTLL